MSDEMKTYIIVHHTPLLIPDWGQLCSAGKYNVVLITNQACFATMTKPEVDLFDAIHLTDDFEYKNLRSIFEQKILPKYSGAKSIVTNEEYALVPCAKLREHFNIPGNSVEQVLPFRDKIVMKQKLAGIDCLPKYCVFDREKFINDKDKYVKNLIQKLGLPVFVKPTADAGSNNAKKLFTADELLNWCEDNLGNHKEFELDEYIAGDAYQCDALIKDNKILHVQISKYLCPEYYFLHGKPACNISLLENSEDYLLFKDFNEKIIRELKFVPNGATHFEFFKTAENKLVFLEIAARPPGIFTTHAYKKEINLDYKTIHYQLQMGLDVDLRIKKGPYCGHAWFPKISGTVASINEPKHFGSKYDFKTRVKLGEVLSKANRLGDFAATLMFWNDDYQVLQNDFNSLAEFAVISTEVN